MTDAICACLLQPVRDEVRPVAYSVAFSPDGSHLVAAVGARIFVYNSDGSLWHTLKGHTDAIYALAYARDGSRFASGGADNTVIAWSSDGQGLLKYKHAGSIQSLAYNPITQQLASISETDLGLWSPEVRSVPKTIIPSRPLCIAWSPDGQLLALGCEDGSVSIRDKTGAPHASIARHAPVWTVAFAPNNSCKDSMTLAVTSWDGNLAFFKADGTPALADDIPLGFNACCLAYSSDGKYIIVGGSNSKLVLYTDSGILIETIVSRPSWVWSCSVKPNSHKATIQTICGCDDGGISFDTVSLLTVHCMYKDCYAHRDNLTDVIIQPLSGGQRTRIKCQDYVKNIAVYRNLAAVQTSAGVTIYEGKNSDNSLLQYRVKYKLPHHPCDLLVVTAQHLLLFNKRRLTSYSLDGTEAGDASPLGKHARSWKLDANVRFVKCLGGPPGGEGVLVGCRDGQVVTVFLDNPFPVPIWKHSSGVRCVDISSKRLILALVDELGFLKVINLQTGQVCREDENVSSVAFNTENEELLAYTSNSMLCICATPHKPHKQMMPSVVVAFTGAKVYCLSGLRMKTEDVPLSSIVQQYIQTRSWSQAYRVACLGVTPKDWSHLAHAALLDLCIDVARKAFVRTQDLLMISLVNQMEMQSSMHGTLDAMKGEILAYQGCYNEAADRFAHCGAHQRVLDMWTDLRQFDKAKAYIQKAGDVGQQDALRARQAAWSEEVCDYKDAANMHLESGNVDRAVALLLQHSNDWGHLLGVARNLDRDKDRPALSQIATVMLRNQQNEAAKEVLLKLEDWEALVDIHVEDEAWHLAFMTAKRGPDLERQLHARHAAWLANNHRHSEGYCRSAIWLVVYELMDISNSVLGVGYVQGNWTYEVHFPTLCCQMYLFRHEEARAAYVRAEKPEEARRILEEILDSSIACSNFHQASYCMYHLAIDHQKGIKNKTGFLDRSEQRALSQFALCYQQSGLYHAYDVIHRTMTMPFSVGSPKLVFNCARFLFSALLRSPAPAGISTSTVAWILAQESERHGAWKVARLAYAKLQSLKVPQAWQEQIDQKSVLIRAQPLMDDSCLVSHCPRCSAPIPLVCLHSDACASCGAKIMLSSATYQELALIEFELADGISESHAMELISAEPKEGHCRVVQSHDDTLYGRGENPDFLRLDEDKDAAPNSSKELFQSQLSVSNTKLVADQAVLRNLTHADVLVRRWPNANIPSQFFWIKDDQHQDFCIGACQHFYELEDYEMLSLTQGCRPICRDALPGTDT